MISDICTHKQYFIHPTIILVVNRTAPLQTSTATRLTFIDQRANRTEEVNLATRLGPVTARSSTLTNERSHSGSGAQPTALYNEVATLCSATRFITNAEWHDFNTSALLHRQTGLPPSILSYTNTQREYGPTLITCTHNYTYTSHFHEKLDKYHTELYLVRNQKLGPLQHPNTHDTPHRRT
ncbi:hypothetical protein FHG87_014682 [Trinorchestia longiramus]|nr:hypothetical protein FHG87_014682 [Trinorchestia longiramus]